MGSLSAKHAKNKGFIGGQVEVIEPLGAQTYIYLKNNDHEFTARVEPNESINVGENIKVPINLDKIHLFDPQNESRIDFKRVSS